MQMKLQRADGPLQMPFFMPPENYSGGPNMGTSGRSHALTIQPRLLLGT